jgi:hypothetical protein
MVEEKKHELQRRNQVPRQLQHKVLLQKSGKTTVLAGIQADGMTLQQPSQVFDKLSG